MRHYPEYSRYRSAARWSHLPRSVLMYIERSRKYRRAKVIELHGPARKIISNPLNPGVYYGDDKKEEKKGISYDFGGGINVEHM